MRTRFDGNSGLVIKGKNMNVVILLPMNTCKLQ